MFSGVYQIIQLNQNAILITYKNGSKIGGGITITFVKLTYNLILLSIAQK